MSAHPKLVSKVRPLDLLRLESRDVPATFYVDPSLTNPQDSKTYTFNAGQPNQVTGLTFGATESTAGATLFSSLKVALAKAAANTEADTILLANGDIAVDNSAGEVTISDQITLVGSGKGVTTLRPTADTPDASFGVIVVTGGTAPRLTATDFTFDGAGKQVGNAFFYITGTGTIDRAAIKNVQLGTSFGSAVTAGNKSFVVVQRTEITNYGRSGVWFYDSDGWVVGNTITGRGSGIGDAVNYGVLVTGGSYTELWLNTISNNTASTVAGEGSAGVLMYEEEGKAPGANIVNNTFATNTQGVRVGFQRGADASTAAISRNNFATTNTFAVVAANNTLVNARRNHWGAKTGPFDPSTADGSFNPNSPGAKVDTQVDYAGWLKRPFEQGEVPGAFAVGSGTAGGPSYLFAGSGALQIEVPAFPGFVGPVRVATGDVNGDGTPDLIRSFGPGLGSRVQAYDGKTGAQLYNFDAYGQFAGNRFTSFTGGVYVASGDVNGDGFDDIITGPGAGFGAVVKVFSGKTGAQIREFTAFTSLDPNFGGGVTVAAGDVGNDGFADIIAGTATQSNLVQVYDAFYNPNVGNGIYQSFFAFDPAFTGGVNVSAGDLNGDGRADVFVGAPIGAGPLVRGWTTNFDGTRGALSTEFVATTGTSQFTGGVRVAARDLDDDGLADLVLGLGAAPGSDTKFRIVNAKNVGLTFFPPANLTTSAAVFSYADAGGLFVG